jgi:hypothetical protein
MLKTNLTVLSSHLFLSTSPSAKKSSLLSQAKIKIKLAVDEFYCYTKSEGSDVLKERIQQAGKAYQFLIQHVVQHDFQLISLMDAKKETRHSKVEKGEDVILRKIFAWKRIPCNSSILRNVQDVEKNQILSEMTGIERRANV